MTDYVAFLRGINVGASKRVKMAELREALERACAERERVAVRGRHVYACHPDGIRDSKLAKQIDSRHLGVKATASNWRTVTKMLELTRG